MERNILKNTLEELKQIWFNYFSYMLQLYIINILLLPYIITNNVLVIIKYLINKPFIFVKK